MEQRDTLHRLRKILATAVVGFIGATCVLCAQQASAAAPKLDLAVTYDTMHSLKANAGQTFWMEGGSLELGANLWRGLGFALDVTGSTTSSIGSSGIPLSMVTTVIGPHYRWQPRRFDRISLYGEALIGESDGFYSLFPTPYRPISSSNAFAFQTGGGIDYRLGRRFGLRLLDVGYLRTQFPNSTDDQQNTLRLGTGFVARFGH